MTPTAPPHTPPFTPQEAMMTRALALASAQLGRTAPNPSVGCVIEAGGHVIAEAATGDGGRPHAEEAALALAGGRAAGATAYVSLEPCSMRTSGAASCCDRLIASGVAHVVIGCAEPHAAARGGAEILRRAGVRVTVNVLHAQAEAVNIGFFTRLATGRPWLAASEDGSGFDALFEPRPGESHEEALDRLGALGLTRVYVPAGAPIASDLRARGLLV